MAMVEATSALQVYMIEDSPIFSRLLSAAVESAGAELVGHSDNAEQAIADLSRVEADLILVDVTLDSGSGFDVLEALQKSGKARAATKVVLTNHTAAEYGSLSYSLGATYFYEKDRDSWRVLELISRMAAEK
ncbi:MAG TPA: response regulator [Casimicrobiaceae bacterium]